MAKQSRGGLGRGLGSLMSGSYSSDQSFKNDDSSSEAKAKKETTSNTPVRERIVYDAREDTTFDADSIPEAKSSLDPAETGKFPAINVNDVSRETSEQSSVNNPRNISKQDDDTSENMILTVAIESVVPNPEQPRTNFKEEDLKELSNSIKREGVIQPILVRKIESGEYQIIAGERRWQASKLAGLESVPVQVREVDDEKALELALIENIQRTDLNPIEEAYGYKRLMERNKMTQADIAQAVSKGRSTIANALRLLELPEDAQQLLFEDKITAGHARAILSVPDKEGRAKLTRKLADEKLSVRDTENLARLMANKPAKPAHREPIPALYKSVARELKAVLKTGVKVKSTKGKNKIEIEFKDERDLERLFDIIVPE